LGQVHRPRLPVALDLDAEHPVELAEVGDLNVLAHARFEGVHKARAACGDGAVVYMHGDDCDVTGLLVS
jgi:hypothetical protein